MTNDKAARREREKREEQDRISHAIHGYPVEIVGGGGDAKGVTIMSKNGIVDQNEHLNKGVEIIDPRHGHKDSKRSGE